MDEKIKGLQRTLGLFFKHAYYNRASLTLLYEKSLEIGNRLREICPDYETNKELRSLVDAVEFAYELHDEETRRNSAIKIKVYHHYTNLLSDV